MTDKPPEATYELLDPEKITVRNSRNAVPSAHLIATIRQFGVLQPVRVIRTPDGELRLWLGDRRRKACIQLGIPVPAIVVAGTVDTTDDEVNRIFGQWTENEDRQNFTAAERVSAVATLFDLGVSDRRIGGATGLSKPEIAAARKAAASTAVRTLAAQYPLDITQAAVIAEFDGNIALAEHLAEVARDNPAQFNHAAERARDQRDEAAMLAARTTELTAGGHAVVTERLHYENGLIYWAGQDGKQLTPENHKDCPGAVVTLQAWGYKDSRRIEETWSCTDPKEFGHKKFRSSSQPDKDPEEASAERRRVLENNKQWRAAATVRQQWLRDVLLQRKTLPEGAALFTARTIAAADSFLLNALSTMSGGTHKTARELLGVGKDEHTGDGRITPLFDSLNGISEQRAQVVTLALVLGAYEGQTADPYTWKHPSRTAQEYLTALAGWGYPLSPIEQTVVDAGEAGRG